MNEFLTGFASELLKLASASDESLMQAAEPTTSPKIQEYRSPPVPTVSRKMYKTKTQMAMENKHRESANTERRSNDFVRSVEGVV